MLLLRCQLPVPKHRASVTSLCAVFCGCSKPRADRHPAKGTAHNITTFGIATGGFWLVLPLLARSFRLVCSEPRVAVFAPELGSVPVYLIPLWAAAIGTVARICKDGRRVNCTFQWPPFEPGTTSGAAPLLIRFKSQFLASGRALITINAFALLVAFLMLPVLYWKHDASFRGVHGPKSQVGVGQILSLLRH